jgi:hypothetical protein
MKCINEDKVNDRTLTLYLLSLKYKIARNATNTRHKREMAEKNKEIKNMKNYIYANTNNTFDILDEIFPPSMDNIIHQEIKKLKLNNDSLSNINKYQYRELESLKNVMDAKDLELENYKTNYSKKRIRNKPPEKIKPKPKKPIDDVMDPITEEVNSNFIYKQTPEDIAFEKELIKEEQKRDKFINDNLDKPYFQEYVEYQKFNNGQLNLTNYNEFYKEKCEELQWEKDKIAQDTNNKHIIESHKKEQKQIMKDSIEKISKLQKACDIELPEDANIDDLMNDLMD